MTPREAFKASFLLKCAEEGLTGPQVRDRIHAAVETLLKRAGLLDVGVTAALAAPVVAGAGVGYLAHRAAVPQIDNDDVKKRELIEEFRHFARRARDHQKIKSLKLAGA